jgi:hypothetical protein
MDSLPPGGTPQKTNAMATISSGSQLSLVFNEWFEDGGDRRREQHRHPLGQIAGPCRLVSDQSRQQAYAMQAKCLNACRQSLGRYFNTLDDK